MIPKKVHYIWLGGSSLPPSALKCIESWKRKLPDFELNLWNESNLKISDPAYLRALKAKKWAFGADVARLQVLLDHGGIYLDTDIEVIKDLTPLLSTELFIGREDDKLIGAGIIGSVPGNEFIRDALACVKKSLDSDYIPIPNILTPLYKKNTGNYRFKHEIYPKDYFYPYNPFVSEVKNLFFSDISENTYVIHHWDHSWKGGLLEQAYRKIKKALKKPLSI